MTIFSEFLKDKFNSLLQEDLSTKDRSTGFRIMVAVLIVLSLFLIIYCLLR